jgi:uncharacterized damage-inducible protein DinB
MHTRTGSLLLMLQQGWGPRAWHGTALRGAVRGVTATQALWRPAPGRHNIWELVLHMAYWKYAVARRISGVARGSFPREGSNWIPVTDSSERAWKADVALLQRQHAFLVAAVKTLPASRLDSKDASKWTHAERIAGAAAHDLYHTGQIQLIKRLAVAGARTGRGRS